MSLFDLIFRPKGNKKAEEAKNQGVRFLQIGNYNSVFTSQAGEIYENLLVRASIDARARHIAKLKISTSGSAKTGLQNKLKSGPNQWQTWYQFLYRTSTILDIHNTAYIVPVRDESFRITGYYPILPNRAEIVSYEDKLYIRYKFRSGEVAAVLFDECANLTKFQYSSDFIGEKSQALDDTFKLINLQNKGIEAAVNNATDYKFYAQLNNFTIDTDLKNERKQFTDLNLKNDDDANGLLLFPNNYSDIHQIQQVAYQVQPEERKLIQENVFMYFGTNMAILTNSADSTQLDAFYNGAIETFAIQFSECMEKAIFTERERIANNKFIAHANRLQYMSNSEKVQLAKELGDRGALTINEIRELFNYAEIDGGDVAPIRGEYKSTTTLKDLANEDSNEDSNEDTNEDTNENSNEDTNEDLENTNNPDESGNNNKIKEEKEE